METVVLTRAPLRISFAGEGTDLPGYYQRRGGLAISATINYYVYTILTPNSKEDTEIIYANPRASSQYSGSEDMIWYNDLSLPKAITHHFNIHDGLTVFLSSQVPPGTGLGTSGSVAVSMIKALAFCCGLDLAPREVAELACYIEIDKMSMPVGKQDPYAVAFGGLNHITFSRDDIVVEPIVVPGTRHQQLREGLMFFFCDAARQSSDILHRQQQAIQRGERAFMDRLDAIKALGVDMRSALETGDLDAFADLLHRSWLEKRQLTSGISNPNLDRYYQVARECGALGGRITGAGGGGLLMLYCPKERQPAVIEALAALGVEHWPLLLEDEGVQLMQLVPWARQQVLPTPSWSQPSPAPMARYRNDATFASRTR
jgi:D-glycero-alpha-D-manno-heptose-7-phosphate kinase